MMQAIYWHVWTVHRETNGIVADESGVTFTDANARIRIGNAIERQNQATSEYARNLESTRDVSFETRITTSMTLR